MFIFTDRRLVLVDKECFTGKRAEYQFIPYRAITHFSVEKAGVFDMDVEMKVYISGNPVPSSLSSSTGRILSASRKPWRSLF